MSACTEKQSHLPSQDEFNVNSMRTEASSLLHFVPYGLIVPKHQMFLQKMLLSSHCFIALFFRGGHCLSQETLLVPALFSSKQPSAPGTSSTNHIFCDLFHYVSASLTQCIIFMELVFLGRRAERKEGVYKNNETELCLKMFRITHL